MKKSFLLLLVLLFVGLLAIWPLCSFATKKVDKPAVGRIYGRIQFVDSFADFKVQEVHAFPDLRVQTVTAFPDAAGQWHIVDSFPDYKIQMVNAFPDFTVQFVDSFPSKGK